MNIEKIKKGEYLVTVGNGMDKRVKKDPYDWLWNVWSVDCVGAGKWAGPFATKRQAVEAIENHYN